MISSLTLLIADSRGMGAHGHPWLSDAFLVVAMVLFVAAFLMRNFTYGVRPGRALIAVNVAALGLAFLAAALFVA